MKHFVDIAAKKDAKVLPQIRHGTHLTHQNSKETKYLIYNLAIATSSVFRTKKLIHLFLKKQWGNSYKKIRIRTF